MFKLTQLEITKKGFVYIGILCYILAMIFAHLDGMFKYIWLELFLWLIAITSILLSAIYPVNFKINLKEKKYIWFGIILLLAIFSRFFLINVYPYTSVGDQLRDGGLDAMRIVNGTTLNLFGYDNFYTAHGTIIPTFSSLFYRIFTSSTYTFIIPSAILSIIDIVIVYIIGIKFFNQKVAIFSSLALICLPIDLYYARTEVVVVFSALFTSLILINLFSLLKTFETKYYVLLGLILGFSLGLHASMKPVIGITIAVIIAFTFKKYFKKKKLLLKLLLYLTITILIGFGPRILYTTPAIFTHQSVVPIIQDNDNKNKNIPQLLIKSIENYPPSFLTYFYETSNFHFGSNKPLLDFPIGLLFLIGLIAAIFSKNKYLLILTLFIFILPYSNSAITDGINENHRYAPLFVISSIIVGYGVNQILTITNRGKKLNIVSTSLIACLFFYILFTFFYEGAASISMFRHGEITNSYQDYMLTEAIQLIKNNKELSSNKNLCIIASPITYKYLIQLHVREQFEYFTPENKFTFLKDNNLSNNTLEISYTCEPSYLKEINWTKQEYCKKEEKFICPPDKLPFFLYTQS